MNQTAYVYEDFDDAKKVAHRLSELFGKPFFSVATGPDFTGPFEVVDADHYEKGTIGFVNYPVVYLEKWSWYKRVGIK